MGQYGEIARKARNLIVDLNMHPFVAWTKAAADTITKPSCIEKGCPRSAFIGLCEEGYVKGVKKGKYSLRKRNNQPNKDYAIEGVIYLIKNGDKGISNKNLWNLIFKPGNFSKAKNENGQMDVVLALWRNKLIQMP